MDDFMQWAMNSLDDQQQHVAAPPPFCGGGGDDSGGTGLAAVPALEVLPWQSTGGRGVGVQDLPVQVNQHLASNSWSTNSGDSPGAAVMYHDVITVGWSPHTALARTSTPVSWNFNASPAAATATSARGGPSTPAAGWRARGLVGASHGQGGGTTAASSSGSDHVIAERLRREKINQCFIELSTVIPGLKKMDKATILGDAVIYVKEMREKVKKLENAAATTTIRSAVLVNKKIKPCLGQAGESSKGGLLEIDVWVSDEKSVLVQIQCENARGILARLLAELESLCLAITHTSVMPFLVTTAIITVTAKMEGGFNSTVEQIVGKLNSVLNRSA